MDIRNTTLAGGPLPASYGNFSNPFPATRPSGQLFRTCVLYSRLNRCIQVTFCISSLQPLEWARESADMVSLTLDISQFHTSLGTGKGVTVSNSLMLGTVPRFRGEAEAAEGGMEDAFTVLRSLGDSCWLCTTPGSLTAAPGFCWAGGGAADTTCLARLLISGFSCYR